MSRYRNGFDSVLGTLTALYLATGAICFLVGYGLSPLAVAGAVAVLLAGVLPLSSGPRRC